MSRIEKILQAMIDETSYDEAPQSRIETILLAIKNNTQYSYLPYSRIEEILLAIKNNTSCDKESMSRIEEILLAKLNSVEYKKPVQSKIEKLLLKWLYQDLYLTLKGVPPLTFTANGQRLINWTIYGNTVNGESVGDRTGNLFDGNFLQGYWAYADGSFIYIRTWICTSKIPCTGGRTYTYSFSKASRWFGFVWYDADGNYISTNNLQDSSATQYRLYSATAPSNAAFMVVNIAGYPDYNGTISPSNITDFMLVEGQYTSETMPNYEPYGYRVPVTVTNGMDTQIINIYLTKQIKMVGDEAEYIDFGEQKQYFADGTSVDVTLPALPTLSGTNTMSVGTQVQPSNMKIIYAPKEPEYDEKN